MIFPHDCFLIQKTHNGNFTLCTSKFFLIAFLLGGFCILDVCPTLQNEIIVTDLLIWLMLCSLLTVLVQYCSSVYELDVTFKISL